MTLLSKQGWTIYVGRAPTETKRDQWGKAVCISACADDQRSADTSVSILLCLLLPKQKVWVYIQKTVSVWLLSVYFACHNSRDFT